MNLYATIADVIRRFPDKTALSSAQQQLSYREFDLATAAAAAHYRSLGCERGDRVLLFLKNSLQYPILLMAAVRAGLVIVPVNAKLHPSEVAWICSDAQVKVVVTHQEHILPLRTALSSSAEPHLIALEKWKSAPREPPLEPAADVEPDTAAWLFYTSGTTGRPKGAVLTHRNLIAATVNCLADMFAFEARDRVLHVAPLSHASGIYLIPAMVRAAENVIPAQPRFDPDEVLDWVAERGITVLAFVAPTMIVRLLSARTRSDIGSLRGVIYGGSTIHLEHIRAAVRRFGAIFHQLYGQGEVPMTISHLPACAHLDSDDDTLLSAGYVRVGMEVRIVGDDDAEVPHGEDGEICVRGDVVMSGYWRNPTASAAALRGGWLHTGDIGRFDRGGRLRVLDRRYDTIISGGTNIYPKEIEDVIAAHPAVREAVAFGVPDPEWGETVALVIVAHENSGLDEAQVIDFCNQRMARFKQPRRVIFLNELPKSAYGKVLRRELKGRYSNTTTESS
jgi:acyl-CoA synthetase (AMP-forming)/AMP-acid ligase II